MIEKVKTDSEIEREERKRRRNNDPFWLSANSSLPPSLRAAIEVFTTFLTSLLKGTQCQKCQIGNLKIAAQESEWVKAKESWKQQVGEIKIV